MAINKTVLIWPGIFYILLDYLLKNTKKPHHPQKDQARGQSGRPGFTITAKVRGFHKVQFK